MQAVEKFKSDLDQALRRADSGKPAAAAMRAFFEREFPQVRGETGDALLGDFEEKWRADPAAAAAWLETVGSIIMMDYDGSALSAEDWAGIRESFSAGSDELDLELLTYAMSLVLEHRAL